MFFKTNDFDISIQSALELNWKKRNDYSDIRPYNALSIRVNGDAVFEHENGQTRAKSGDIVFVPSFFNYKLISGNERLYVIHFLSEKTLCDSIKCFSPKNTAYFIRRFEELYNIWHKKSIGFEYECKSIFYKIISGIEKDHAFKQHKEYTDIIGEAIDYIHENYTNTNISVDKLAKRCSISGAYMRRLFHKRFNMSPQRYINILRLQYAVELLKSGYYNVCEVSEICGFQNVHYFSYFIKKESGLTPSEIMRNK